MEDGDKPPAMRISIQPRSKRRLPGEDYYHTPRPETFGSLASGLESVESPEVARHLLYHSVQAAFDLLADSRQLGDGQRHSVRKVLSDLTAANASYLRSYYIDGSPDIGIAKSASSVARQLEPHPYWHKRRNIDYNQIYPDDIGRFLDGAILSIGSGKLRLPGVVVAAACGSTEAAMPLADLVGADLMFVRMSKRRHDESPIVLPEDAEMLSSVCKGRDALVVEDFVCSGRSIKSIMGLVSGLSVASVTGASVMATSREEQGSRFDQIRIHPNFYQFHIA
jgi:hypothetical protein